VKNFDDLKAADRTFTVVGETFSWKDVRPEVLTSFEVSANGDDANAVWKMLDEQIMLFLPEAEQEKWREVRLREEDPVTIAQLNAILTWLMEEQTGRPTVTPAPSDSGRGRTAASSKAA
jgi:hypothetical protein